MMTGAVNAELDATLRLTVRDASGQDHEIDAVIDAGFNGSLTLSPAFIAVLGLPWLGRQSGQLGDGSFAIFDVYAAIIVWDGQPRSVEVEAADGSPLLGMELLRGCELCAHVVTGGTVTITAVP